MTLPRPAHYIRKRRALLTAALAALAVLGAVLWFTLRAPVPEAFRTPAQNRNILIAHAAGSVNGHTYTNSKEALELAEKQGFRFIELDLEVTTDGSVVAVHEWPQFNEMTGGASEKPLSLSEFTSRKILGSLTPLTAPEIQDFFAAHPDLYLVTDKIEDFQRLLDQIRIPRDRLLVEVFSYKKYKEALTSGIRYPMLCMWDKKSLERHRERLLNGRIKMITLPVSLILEAEKELEALYQRGVTIFAFTSDDPQFIEQYGNRCVTGFYTDYIAPQ